MNLQDAVAQYADMITLGSEALKRLAEQQRDFGETHEVHATIDKIVHLAEQLRASVCRPD